MEPTIYLTAVMSVMQVNPPAMYMKDTVNALLRQTGLKDGVEGVFVHKTGDWTYAAFQYGKDTSSDVTTYVENLIVIYGKQSGGASVESVRTHWDGFLGLLRKELGEGATVVVRALSIGDKECCV